MMLMLVMEVRENGQCSLMVEVEIDENANTVRRNNNIVG